MQGLLLLKSTKGDILIDVFKVVIQDSPYPLPIEHTMVYSF
jgi:hypothetical protein